MDPHRQADRLRPRRNLPAATLACAGALGLAACARMEPPPGGPEDKTRPYVAAVYPAPGAVNAPRELKARIAFSEWVAKDAERGKVWISPPPAGRLEVKARGEVLEISSDAQLDSGTTYVLGVAGTVKDLVGQPLEAPFRLTFSTGPALDTSALEGRLAAFPGAPAPAGAFAALYPEDRALRARFAHLAPRRAAKGGDEGGTPAIFPADSLPDPFREKPAYLASADSLGRFRLEGMRPGRYLLLGFLDADQDAMPDAVTEKLAPGPMVSVAAGAGAPRSLALSTLDTAANRLMEARWAHESLRLGLSRGTVRLRFSRPLHPSQALRRELYTVRKEAARKDGARKDSSAGPADAIPVMDLCLNPDGELELYTAPLAPGGRYVVACGAVPDAQGNPLDTARDEAAFTAALGDSAAKTTAAAPAPAPAAGTASGDTAWPAPVFLGARRVGGSRGNQAQEPLFPSRGLFAYYPRILGDSLIAELRARLEVKADTIAVPFTLERVSHHEFRLRFTGSVPLRGQALTVGYKAPRPDSAKPPAGATGPAAPAKPAAQAAPGAPGAPRNPSAPALPRVSLPVADSAKLGSLRFLQDASARGAVLVLRSLGSGIEVSRITPGQDEFTVDSLPEGWYAAAYFRDADRDTLWNPGRLRPWTPQEEFVLLADSIQVKPGGAGGPAGARLAFPPSW